MTSIGKVTSEQSAEPTGVNRLDPWMRHHPQYVAGIWAFFALTSAVSAVLADGDEPMLALTLALTLGWTLLAFREVRRYWAQR
jgi:hypothetical protein